MLYLNTILPDYVDVDSLEKKLKENGFNPKLKYRIQAFIHYILTRHRSLKFIKRDESKEITEWLNIHHLDRRLILGQKDYTALVELFDGVLYEVRKNEKGEPDVIENVRSMGFKLLNYTKQKTLKLPDSWSVTLLERARTKAVFNDKYYHHVIAMTDKFRLRNTSQSLNDVDVFLGKNTQQFNSYLTPKLFVELFNTNELIFPKCDNYGNRLHTKVSSLPKILRKHLYIEGFESEKLACIDFKNSQPFIFGNINYKLLGKHIPECKEAIDILKNHSCKSDFKAYAKLTQEGLFYEDFVDKLNHEFNSQVSRDDAKKMFMYVLFCNYNAAESLIKNAKLKFEPVEMFGEKGNGTDEFKAQCYYVFKKYYPSVHQSIIELKSLNWRGISTSKSIHYSQNCLLLQRYESALFYRVIIPYLVAHQHYYYTTVHDSIICFEKEAESIKTLIIGGFNGVGQVSPKFDLKYYA